MSAGSERVWAIAGAAPLEVSEGEEVDRNGGGEVGEVHVIDVGQAIEVTTVGDGAWAADTSKRERCG